MTLASQSSPNITSPLLKTSTYKISCFKRKFISLKKIQSNLNVIPLIPSLKSKAIVIWVNSPLPKVPDGEVYLLHWVFLPLSVINVSQLKEGEDAGLTDNTKEPSEAHNLI